MPASNVNDLSAHTSTLVALLGIATTVAALLLYRLINSIDRKVDVALQCLKVLADGCIMRNAECGKEFIHQTEFTAWKAGRDGPGGLWEAINKLRDARVERTK